MKISSRSRDPLIGQCDTLLETQSVINKPPLLLNQNRLIGDQKQADELWPNQSILSCEDLLIDPIQISSNLETSDKTNTNLLLENEEQLFNFVNRTYCPVARDKDLHPEHPMVDSRRLRSHALSEAPSGTDIPATVTNTCSVLLDAVMNVPGNELDQYTSYSVDVPTRQSNHAVEGKDMDKRSECKVKGLS